MVLNTCRHSSRKIYGMLEIRKKDLAIKYSLAHLYLQVFQCVYLHMFDIQTSLHDQTRRADASGKSLSGESQLAFLYILK